VTATTRDQEDYGDELETDFRMGGAVVGMKMEKTSLYLEVRRAGPAVVVELPVEYTVTSRSECYC